MLSASAEKIPLKTGTAKLRERLLSLSFPKEQVQKRITTGKTDLLPKFISPKGRPSPRI
jgi:hypothetical protein